MSRRSPSPDAFTARGLQLPLVALGLTALLAVGAACPDERADKPPTSAAKPPSSPAPTTSAPPSVADDEDTEPQRPSGPPFEVKPAGKRVTVLYTASVQGYVAPCGCTAEPLGGVARLAAAIDEAQAKHQGQVLFVDAGDLLFEREHDDAPADACQAEARQDLLVSTYARKGLAATTLGPLDDVRGPTWRDALMAKHGVVTLAANPSRKLTSGAKQVGHLVKQVGDVRVGLTAFRVDDAGQLPSATVALAKALKALTAASVDAIVVLAQADRSLLRRVAADPSVAAADVFIVGHRPGEVPVAPERVSPTGPVIVSAGMQAQHLGVLEMELAGREGPLALDDREAAAERRASLLRIRVKQYAGRVAEEPEGTRRAFLAQKLARAREELKTIFVDAANKPPPAGAHIKARSVALVRGSDEEPEAKKGLDAYEASIPTLVRKCEAGVECPAPAEGQASYVGVQMCFNCHKQAVQFWQQQKVELPFTAADGTQKTRLVGHSKAWETLAPGNKTSDRSCVGCHSIGFMEPGGYCKTSEVDFRKNVQCEACHGPGSIHVEAMGTKETLAVQEVTETVCRGCHHVPHIPTTESFVFEDKLLHILGPGHGEKRRAAIAAKRGNAPRPKTPPSPSKGH